MTKRLFILCVCVLLGGCMPHFKDADSYDTMFRTSRAPGVGDPYAFGGIAEGSGGTMARQSYATDNGSPDFRDATDSGKLGEISKERSQTPGSFPGETEALPGAAQGASDVSAVEGRPEVQFISSQAGQAIGPGDPARPQPGGSAPAGR